MSLRFDLLGRRDGARRGRLETAHGTVETPAFMPVGTLGAVKGITPAQLRDAGAQIMLANLYHLALRPGIEVIEELGGLHDFNGWSGPMLTDSGGYQVFSLADRRTVDADGVSFRSHLDGSEIRFTPEAVVGMQARLGVDIAMVLDECPPYPVEKPEAEAALQRTQEWARRSRASWVEQPGRGLFAIVQGSVYPDLRARGVSDLIGLDFEGYAIGGVSVGEPPELRREVVQDTVPQLPAEKPRYLMGVGTPDDLAHAVSCGVDLFDCVLPSRNARHGLLYTRAGTLQIKNAAFRRDARPIDEGCACPTCEGISRAFLHHLIRSREVTGMVLATLHNVRFYLDFMADLREAIASGRPSDAASRSDADPPPGEPTRP